jgi:Uma2 family endonuclease
MSGRDATGSTSILSAEDLQGVPDPDLPHELWHGELRVVMPASGAHGVAVSRLTVMLGQHVYAHDLGELFTESTGFLLERDPDTLLCPDVAFVAKGRPAGRAVPRPLPAGLTAECAPARRDQGTAASRSLLVSASSLARR